MPISDILTSDPVSVYRTKINAVLDVVNSAATSLSGAIGSRPAPGVEGRIFRVSSGIGQGMVLYDAGSAWVSLCDPAPGVKANRPAIADVPIGTRYYATDESCEYTSNGSAWFQSGGIRPSTRVTMSADFSLPNNVETTISFDTELYDAGLHDPAVNPERVNLPTAGIWLVTAQAVLYPSADATDTYLRIVSGSGGGGAYAQTPAKNGVYSVLHATTLIKVGAPFGVSSYATMAVKQNSGASATLSKNQRGGCFLEATQISGV